MCTNVFINKNEYKIEARSMDFPMNIAFQNCISYVGIDNTMDIVIDADKIPDSQLTSWKTRYGFFGRLAFDKCLTDGLNTQGLSFSFLYLDVTKHPTFNPEDKRKVLSVYYIGNFLLSMAKDVPEALKLIAEHQLVGGALELKPGTFVKNIPIHFSLRDSKGNTTVVEFVDGEVKVYENKGNILTNAPTYDWHLENIKEYKSLLEPFEDSNSQFSDKTINYKDTISSSRPEVAQLIGMPGDFSGVSRFVRAYILSQLVPEPQSNREACFHASSIINNVSVPPYEVSMTLWTTIKDLKNLIVSYKDIAAYQGNSPIGVYAAGINEGYISYDLKAMNFTDVPLEANKHIIKPTPKEKIIEIVNMSDVVGLERQ
ncbi:linear amide C-N hydrolase [Francisella sp. LA112445]|uniref:linear amide C-N hydrolase n=1 Tax=Francisella sp. LA112445 TaxID=1395624 RepID=UPI001788BAD7|nr:linear amide C-N hydrolase [Francisella sp. LA112445]QIW10325.1 linear amide C-N hydrolase [Francisella sp. LA112445]